MSNTLGVDTIIPYGTGASATIGNTTFRFNSIHANTLWGADTIAKPISEIALLSDIPSSLPANGGTASTISGYASEVFTFTLSDNTTVSKTFLVGE